MVPVVTVIAPNLRPDTALTFTDHRRDTWRFYSGAVEAAANCPSI
jgi:hypothetical protein